MMLGARTAAWVKSGEGLYRRELSYVYTPNGEIGNDSWWFDAGFTYSDMFGFEINLIRLIDTTSDQAAFGSRNNNVANDSRFFVGCYGSMYYWGWNTLKTVGGITVGKQYRQGLNYLNSRTMTLDGAVIESGLATHVNMSSSRVYFPVYAPNGVSSMRPSSSRTKYYAIGECKMSIGYDIVADYIPVELNDGTITFYDKITEKVMVKSSYARAELREYNAS